MTSSGPRLLAVSDLHIGHRGNQDMLELLRPTHRDDWLIVAGDVAERAEHLFSAMKTLTGRFQRVIWVPGNHELWIGKDDPERNSIAKYARLVEGCQDLGVSTPEDPFPVWTEGGERVHIAPLFVPYDYSWTPAPGQTRSQALAQAREKSVVASDEFLISVDPLPDVAAWCADRLVTTSRRLAEINPAETTVLINHWPLIREPTKVLRYPEFALWCGTDHTADWHRRYRAVACVYGHLHIPRSTVHDGVRFEEVSLGYPREWRGRGYPNPLARQILPAPATPEVRWIRDSNGNPKIAAPGELGDNLDTEQRAEQ